MLGSPKQRVSKTGQAVTTTVANVSGRFSVNGFARCTMNGDLLSLESGKPLQSAFVTNC